MAGGAAGADTATLGAAGEKIKGSNAPSISGNRITHTPKTIGDADEYTIQRRTGAREKEAARSGPIPLI
jgi:hypothetical protein